MSFIIEMKTPYTISMCRVKKDKIKKKKKNVQKNNVPILYISL